MTIGNLRRISVLNNEEDYNELFPLVEEDIHRALFRSSRTESEQYFEIYSTKRAQSDDSDEIESMLERMPDDIKEIVRNGTSKENAAIGRLELDLIDFVLHYNDHRVMSVVGPIGVGKTTFLHYVLRAIRLKSESLKLHLPIIIDCLSTGTEKTTYQDLMFQLWNSFYLHYSDIHCQIPDEIRKKYAKLSNRYTTAADVLQCISEIKHWLRNQYRLLLVYDNLDQLKPSSVARICELGRGIFLSTGIGVIMAMRPATFRTRIELNNDTAAFQRFSLRVTPPDLRSIMRLRINSISKEKRHKSKKLQIKGITIKIGDWPDAINRLAMDYLGISEQKMIVKGLSNNNLRKALVLFERFLKSRDLPIQRILPHRSADRSEIRQFSYFEKYGPKSHLLQGVMHSGNTYFMDCTAVTNLFVLISDNHEPQYLILYRLLSLLHWVRGTIAIEKIFLWGKSYGYTYQQLNSALRHLLVRNLIVSPETESEPQSAKHIKISDCGIFYITELIMDEDYLYEAVYDVPLLHEGYHLSHRDNFTSRMTSIKELAEVYLRRESGQINRLLSSKPPLQPVGAIYKNGLLLRKVISSTGELLCRSQRSSEKVVKEAVRRFQGIFLQFDEDARNLESKIHDYLESFQMLPNDRKIEVPIFSEGERIGYLQCPEQLNPADNHKILVKLLPTVQEYVDPFVIMWNASTDTNILSEIATLEKIPGNVHLADFRIRKVEDPCPMPPFSFMLLSGDRVISKQWIDEPENYIRTFA